MYMLYQEYVKERSKSNSWNELLKALSFNELQLTLFTVYPSRCDCALAPKFILECGSVATTWFWTCLDVHNKLCTITSNSKDLFNKIHNDVQISLLPLMSLVVLCGI